MKATISVIVPVYKVEKYIRQSLDSIIGQTYRDLEIILVDDGSPDNSGAICDEYARRDERVQVIHRKNGGAAAARNDGIQRATGEWIAFADPDDWCELNYYEELLATAQATEADVVYAGGHILETGEKSDKVRIFTEPFCYSDEAAVRSFMLKAIAGKGYRTAAYGYPWDKLYRAAFLKEDHLLFDETCKACDDALFNFNVFDKAAVVAGCTAIGYHYRFVPESITKGYNPDKPRHMYVYLTKLHDYAAERGCSEGLQHALEAVAISAIAVSMNCYYFNSSYPKQIRQRNAEIRELKESRFYHEAIWSRSNQFLSRNQVVLKYALRQPWIWPVAMLQAGKRAVRNR